MLFLSVRPNLFLVLHSFPVFLQQRHGHVPENGSLIFLSEPVAFRRVYHFQTLNNRSLMRLGPLVIVIVVCPSFLAVLFVLAHFLLCYRDPFLLFLVLLSFFAFLLLLLLLLPLCGDLTESAIEEKMNSSSPRVSGKV